MPTMVTIFMRNSFIDKLMEQEYDKSKLRKKSQSYNMYYTDFRGDCKAGSEGETGMNEDVDRLTEDVLEILHKREILNEKKCG